jgi:hypothetical protein
MPPFYQPPPTFLADAPVPRGLVASSRSIP